MGAVRFAIVLAVAALAALALAFLVRSMTAVHKPAPVAIAAPQIIEKPMTRVLVARRDLKVAERLGPDNMAWQAWPADSVNPAYITGGAATAKTDLAATAANTLQNVARDDTAVQALSGSLVREPFLANEPITQRKLVRGGEGGFLAVKLPAGMRAMSIPMTVESDVGGFVLPGDRVDVMLSIKNQAGGDGKAPLSHMVMRNIRVLAIDQNTEPKAAQSSIVGTTATLEVPSADIEALTRAKAQGDLLLILRSYADAAGPSGRVGSPAALDLGDVVRVYRSGQVTETRVAR